MKLDVKATKVVSKAWGLVVFIHGAGTGLLIRGETYATQSEARRAARQRRASRVLEFPLSKVHYRAVRLETVTRAVA